MGNENLSLVLFIDENVYNDYTLGERDNDDTRMRMICRRRNRKRKKEKGRKKSGRECNRERRKIVKCDLLKQKKKKMKRYHV